MKKMFEEVVKMDEEINKAFENGDEELENKLYEKQCEMVKKIEEAGLREEFDNFIENL